MRQSRKGFTMFELMLVTVLIGIVAAITIPIYQAWQAKVRDDKTRKNMQAYQYACEDRMVRDKGIYSFDPDSIAACLPHPLVNSCDYTEMYVPYVASGSLKTLRFAKGQVFFTRCIGEEGGPIPGCYVIFGVGSDGKILSDYLTNLQ